MIYVYVKKDWVLNREVILMKLKFCQKGCLDFPLENQSDLFANDI